MKKIFFCLILILPLIASSQESSKVTSKTAVKRISVGAEIYQDFWLNKPEDMNARAINQGAGTFFMYNVPIGESHLSFAIGAGVSWHNLYSDTRIWNIKADTIIFTPIVDSMNYKKSKMGLTYIDIPLEFRLKTNNKIRASVGFKISYLIDAKTKYKGDNEFGDQVIIKEKQISQTNKWQFGPLVRIGYDWVHIVCYYDLSTVFFKGNGPELAPISLGITFMPF